VPTLSVTATTSTTVATATTITSPSPSSAADVLALQASTKVPAGGHPMWVPPQTPLQQAVPSSVWLLQCHLLRCCWPS
jgi:hypothetical protein